MFSATTRKNVFTCLLGEILLTAGQLGATLKKGTVWLIIGKRQQRIETIHIQQIKRTLLDRILMRLSYTNHVNAIEPMTRGIYSSGRGVAMLGWAIPVNVTSMVHPLFCPCLGWFQVNFSYSWFPYDKDGLVVLATIKQGEGRRQSIEK